MDIGARNSYPSNALSNFAGHRFVLDDVECYSMEGFLQGLKFKSPEMQIEVCKLVGLAAKFKGKKKNWYKTQTLWWKEKPLSRHSEGYQKLLDRAYNAMFEQSESFRNALRAAGKNATFTHSIGRSNPSETVLTEREFCSRLMKLKNRLFEGN